MFLDDVLAAQKRGEPLGIASVCSAHPAVLKQALAAFPHPLIEATCNQVNQFGGYTGMTPRDFVAFVRGIAAEQGFPYERILLGGDHLGPHVWRREPAATAMAHAVGMLEAYVQAGFTKLHLDCSMPLTGDAPGPLSLEVAARRAADMAFAAEQCGSTSLRYVIGTEVPIPGGAANHEEGVRVTSVEAVRATIDLHRRAFRDRGLDSAWERVLALVVQPGVEFGDDFVLSYSPEAARQLRACIEGQPMVFEAHSTDYQTAQALRAMVCDHFAILKVGPALTLAYREAIFALALIENECIPAAARSNILQVLERTMLAEPEYWADYYRGTPDQQAFKRIFSLSDRVRYYWSTPAVQQAVQALMRNLGGQPLPYALSSQFLSETGITANEAIQHKIAAILHTYRLACGTVE